jgi:hypothetical protein
MSSVAEKVLQRKHFDVGYAIYAQGLPVVHCHTETERNGYEAARKGHLAACTAEFLIMGGASPSEADDQLCNLPLQDFIEFCAGEADDLEDSMIEEDWKRWG